jgi:hypothetical protein
MNKDEGGPAFPGPNPSEPGMTLRDYFAAKAMQGYIAHDGDMRHIETVAEMSYHLADAMLEARDAIDEE